MLYQRIQMNLLAAVALVLMLGGEVSATGVTIGGTTYLFDQHEYIPHADSVVTHTRTLLEELFARPLAFECDIYLVNSQARFDSLIGGSFPDWGAAAAIGHLRRIVVKSPDKFNLQRPLGELLAHEYAHLALAERTGWREPPRWFNEGVAQIASMEWSWSGSLTLNQAAVFGDFIPLADIERVNSFDGSRARLAYAQSYMAVHYLFTEYGAESVNIFLDSIASGSSVDEALSSSIGSDYADFDREYRVYLAGRFNLIGLLADTMYFWFALAIILVVGAVIKMRRRKDYYRKWEAEEKLASTDFDYGDSSNPEKPDSDQPWQD